MSDNVTPNGSTRLENTSSLRNSLSFSIKNGDGSNSFVINTPTIINGSPSPGLASSVQTTLVGGGGPVVSATEQAPSNNTTARKRVLPQRPDCINYKPMIPGQNQSYAATASCAKSDYKMEDELIYRRDFSQYISGSNVNHIPNPNGYDNIFQNNFNRFNHSTSQQFVSYGMGKQQQNNIVSSVPLADSNTQVTRSHRKLPPLPIKSEAAALLPNLGRPFLQSIPSLMNNQVHLNQQHSSNHSKNVNAPKSLDFDIHIENNLVHSPCYPYITRNQMNGKSVGDHQLCYGIESTMLRSACTIEDSYYEDGLNGNALGSVKQIIHSNAEDSSGVSSCCTNADSLNPTHRVQNIFIPRHDDEIVLEIGDAVHVEREYDDYWCYGTNLRTGKHGIFPVAHICEIDLVEEICMGALNNPTVKQIPEERDTFYLTMLASIEVAHHKGNDVLVQAINKVMSCYQNKEEILVPQTILMEVSLRGIHVIDKKKKNFFKCPTFDFFYSLQNISFCGAHPKHLKYFGFITKHPLLPRFACHVFLSNESTQPIVEAIGRAFKRSYDEYMAFAHPTEDIYIE
uniref:SH3 domain-containing protein n=1 Tax=Rhabditophanes sp. KR3021 TaxID=114890 RepID=A0AC35U672_9BILA